MVILSNTDSIQEDTKINNQFYLFLCVNVETLLPKGGLTYKWLIKIDSTLGISYFIGKYIVLTNTVNTWYLERIGTVLFSGIPFRIRHCGGQCDQDTDDYRFYHYLLSRNIFIKYWIISNLYFIILNKIFIILFIILVLFFFCSYLVLLKSSTCSFSYPSTSFSFICKGILLLFGSM